MAILPPYIFMSCKIRQKLLDRVFGLNNIELKLLATMYSIDEFGRKWTKFELAEQKTIVYGNHVLFVTEFIRLKKN